MVSCAHVQREALWHPGLSVLEPQRSWRESLSLTRTHWNYNGVKVFLDRFVDDSKVTVTMVKGAKASRTIITRSLDKMALKAHKDKTVQIVVGHEDYIKRVK